MSEMNYIAEAIDTFLTGDDWKYTYNPEKDIFKFGITLHGAIKNLTYYVTVRDTRYTVYGISPMGPDAEEPESLAAMAEFIARANYGLANGNFELDMRDGELRYKTFVNCEDIVPSYEVIRSSIYIPATMFERYSKGIAAVLFSGMSPADAVEMCEN